MMTVEEDGYSAGEENDGSENENVSCSGSDEDSAAGLRMPSAYSRAFGKIMDKSIPHSSVTDTMGPVLAARKNLVIKKLEADAIDKKSKSESASLKREIREKAYTIPKSYRDSKEIDLVKVATKGVVTLFNAVNKAQKIQTDNRSLKSSEAKEAVKKRKAAFLSEIRGVSKAGTLGNQAKKHQSVDDDEPGWSVLQDSFMLGKASLKDWDKKVDVGLDSHQNFEDSESDDSSSEG